MNILNQDSVTRDTGEREDFPVTIRFAVFGAFSILSLHTWWAAEKESSLPRARDLQGLVHRCARCHRVLFTATMPENNVDGVLYYYTCLLILQKLSVL